MATQLHIDYSKTPLSTTPRWIINFQLWSVGGGRGAGGQQRKVNKMRKEYETAKFICWTNWINYETM